MARKIISSDISIGGEFQNGSFNMKLVIDEVMNLMQTNPEYRTFILDYAKGLIK